MKMPKYTWEPVSWHQLESGKSFFFLSKRLRDFDKWVLIKIYQITTKYQYHFGIDGHCSLSWSAPLVSCLAASLSARTQGLWMWNNTDGLFCPLSRGAVTAGHQDKLFVKEIASQIIILLSPASLALCPLLCFFTASETRAWREL